MKLSLIYKTTFTAITFSLITFHAFADDQTQNAWTQAGKAYQTASSWAAPQNSIDAQDALPELEKLRRRMGEFINQGMEDFHRKGYLDGQAGPKTDVLEKDGSYYLLMDLPGVDKNEINIEVKGQELLVSGERKVEDEFKVSNLIKIERRYGNFERVYTIPDEFIADKISAKYENGVLQIKIPRKKVTEEIKPKTIEIA